MITKRFYLVVTAVLALALSFASCSNNDDRGGNGDGDGQIATVKVNLTVAGIQKAGTYAPPTGSENPVADEGTLTSVTLYAFNSSGKFAGLLDFTTITSPTATGTMTLTTGTHNFYAVANASADIKTAITAAGLVQNSTTKEQFEKIILNLTGTDDFAISGGHFMTNSTPSTLNLVAKPAANTLSLAVGRALAKVNVEFNDSNAAGRPVVSQPETGVLSDVRYTVMRNPLKSNLMPYRVSGVLQSAYWNADASTDPVTSFFTSVGSVIETGGVWAATGLLDAANIKTPTALPNAAMYAVENTQAKPLKGTQTTALLEGVFTPKEWLDGMGVVATPAPTKGVTFYRPYLTSSAGAAFEKWFDMKLYNTATLDQTVLDALIATLPSGIPAGESIKIAAYTTGLCYYHIYLEQPGKTTDSERFNVTRNDYFWVGVTEVRGIGHHTPEIIDPEDPITQEAEITANISILPWNVIDNPVVIG